ncbi:hypothetical protein LCGC14_0140680 [marine sediment metagenome]|uniref:Uncharacterized protein n=1 Tax=marine sediment metagenome TaxID=412755 RepID=A0A0F9VG82_9ZZZZ
MQYCYICAQEILASNLPHKCDSGTPESRNCVDCVLRDIEIVRLKGELMCFEEVVKKVCDVELIPAACSAVWRMKLEKLKPLVDELRKLLEE